MINQTTCNIIGNYTSDCMTLILNNSINSHTYIYVGLGLALIIYLSKLLGSLISSNNREWPLLGFNLFLFFLISYYFVHIDNKFNGMIFLVFFVFYILFHKSNFKIASKNPLKMRSYDVYPLVFYMFFMILIVGYLAYYHSNPVLNFLFIILAFTIISSLFYFGFKTYKSGKLYLKNSKIMFIQMYYDEEKKGYMLIDEKHKELFINREEVLRIEYF